MNNEWEYKAALGYGLLATVGWLAIAGSRFYGWRLRTARAAVEMGEFREQLLNYAGGLRVDGIYALLAALVFGFALFRLLQATWNSWDWATALIGGASVLSLILLCTRPRVMAVIPLTMLPYWLLLYRPGVKRACGVGEAEQPRLDEIVAQELPVEPEREQKELEGLYQSLRVFELERGMDTDTFVTRFVKGLEDDTADNEEWFALARLASRARERLAEHNGHQPGSEKLA